MTPCDKPCKYGCEYDQGEVMPDDCGYQVIEPNTCDGALLIETINNYRQKEIEAKKANHIRTYEPTGDHIPNISGGLKVTSKPTGTITARIQG